MMPVTTGASRKVRTVPGTLFLRVGAIDDMGAVCVFEPRIRDAALQQLFDTPILVEKGKMDTAAIRPLLKTALNRVLDKPRIADVWVVSGIARKSRGGLRELPFEEARSCKDVREEEEKLFEKKKKDG